MDKTHPCSVARFIRGVLVLRLPVSRELTVVTFALTAVS